MFNNSILIVCSYVVSDKTLLDYQFSEFYRILKCCEKRVEKFMIEIIFFLHVFNQGNIAESSQCVLEETIGDRKWSSCHVNTDAYVG